MPFSQDLSRECSILQSLQGIAGVPELLHNQCMGDSILMRPVLDPVTATAFFVHKPTQQSSLTRADIKGNSNLVTADCHEGRLSAL